MIILLMAWRNIWRHKVRSMVIIASVALGLLSGVFVLALYKGMLNDRMNTVIHTEVSHLQIHHPEFKEDHHPMFVIMDTSRLTAFLSGSPGVTGFAFRTITHGMLATGSGTAVVQITGINVQTEQIVSQLTKKISEGEGLIEKNKNQVLIGRKLAEKMKLKLRSKLVLTFTDVDDNIVSAAFRVSGIYQTDNAPRDERIVYVHQKALNQLLGTGSSSHEVAIILDDNNSLESYQKALTKNFPQHSVQSWKEISPETRLMIDTTNQYAYIFIVIIMLALSFGIINTMLMAVLERSREIGMLMALGMNRIRIFLLILFETILLTMTGVPVGIGLAWITTIYFEFAGIDTSTFAGEMMSQFGFRSIVYPEFPGERIISTILIVTLAAMVSSLFPSLKAIKLNPIDAMRK